MATQLTFLEEDTINDLKIQIKKNSEKIDNMRKGLFKRQQLEKKALDFLASEVEDLLHQYIYLFEDKHGNDPRAPDKNRTSSKIQDSILL